jgi:hypothetical protein
MKRVVLAGLVGAALAGAVFAVVLALTDVRLTTSTTSTTRVSIVGGSTFAGRTPPPCLDSAPLSFQLGQPQGAAGALAIPVGVRLASGTPCTLDADGRFEIKTAAGAHGIEGNPKSLHLHGAIRKETGVGAFLLWRNWCGPAEDVKFKLTIDGRGSATWHDRSGTPGCEAPGSGAPSTLDLAPISG